MEFKRFTEEIENKVLGFLDDEGVLYDGLDYDIHSTLWEDGKSISIDITDGDMVWAVSQHPGNEQDITIFLAEKGETIGESTYVPIEVLETANVLRVLSANGRLQEVWDYINNEDK